MYTDLIGGSQSLSFTTVELEMATFFFTVKPRSVSSLMTAEYG